GHAIKLRDGRMTVAALGKAPPVFDVQHGHVVKATGDAARTAVAHYRDVNDFRHFAREDPGEMAVVAGYFLIGQERDLAAVRAKLEVAPDQFSAERRGEDGLRIVAVSRRDRFHLVTFLLRAVTGFVDSAKAAVPDNDAAPLLAGGDKTVDDRVHDVAVRREQFAARRGNLDADLVVRQNERAPGAGEIGLTGHGKNETINHAANHGGIGLVLVNRGGIMGNKHDRLRGNDLRIDGGAKE